MRVELFDFELPPERIALRPARPRDAARMLVVGANELGDTFHDLTVRDLPAMLRAGDVLVFNDTRVIPAQLEGRRGPYPNEGARIGATLHKRLGPRRWQAFVRNAKRLRQGHRIDFPAGWKTQNAADAVMAGSPQNDAILQLSLGGRETPEALLQKFGQQQGLQIGNGQRVTVNGLPGATAEFTAQDQQGAALAGRVMFVSYGGTTYQLLGYSTGPRYPSYSSVFSRTMQSFGPLTDPAALGKQPVHLAIVKLPRSMTIEEFYRQYPSTVSLQLITAINGVTAGATLPAGTPAKRVQ